MVMLWWWWSCLRWWLWLLAVVVPVLLAWLFISVGRVKIEVELLVRRGSPDEELQTFPSYNKLWN